MRFFKLDNLLGTVLVFVTMMLAPLVFSPDFFAPLRASLADFKITDIVTSKMRQNALIPPDTNIVLINIENVNNDGLTALVNKLNEKDPKVIGIKKILKQQNDYNSDIALSQALSNVKNLVMCSRLVEVDHQIDQFDSVMTSASIFNVSKNVGFENLLIENDEKLFTIREFVTNAKYKGQELKPFSIIVAEIYNKDKVYKLNKRNNDPEAIFYRGNDKFIQLDAIDVIENNNEVDFKNKIVLLGTVKEIDSTVVLKDVYYTPLNGTYMGKAYPDMHGLVVQANIISMIIDDKYINSSPDWMVFIFSFILVYFNMALFAFLNDKYEKLYEVTSLAAFVVESLTILALTIYFFHKFSYELKATMPIFSIALSILLFEIYHSSLKPLTLKLFHKLTNKEIHHESN